VIDIRINGQEKSLEEELNLAQLIENLGFSDRPIIVEKNGEVIKSDRFDQEPVKDGDYLELIQLMGGG